MKITSLSFAMLSMCLAHAAVANEYDDARRIYHRIASVPPSTEALQTMAAKIKQGKVADAVTEAMKDSNFYNITLKQMFAPMTNKTGDVNVPLNDFTATMIGMVRDDISFDQILYGDIIYVPAAGAAAYNGTSNQPYIDLEASRVSLGDAANLKSEKQSVVFANTYIPAAAEAQGPFTPAGALSTRAFAEAFYFRGTNRAALSGILSGFFCEDITGYHDSKIRNDFIRRDVPRAPGGDPALFEGKCRGCHAGMDGLSNAFAYYDWNEGNPDNPADGALAYLGVVAPKYSVNSQAFPTGYSTIDDRWINYWESGHNARVGWANKDAANPSKGNGIKSLGTMFSQAGQFSKCMATRVFNVACQRPPIASDGAKLEELAAQFRKSSHNMKTLFVDTMSHCVNEPN